ncbi:MAG: hypothetical protein HUJ53_00925, partial [Holdemanella sp.]|nr:hypothetical protein [Holdemanella sp.]
MSSTAKRWLVYLAGLVILALGITLNTKSTLGVSPIVASAYVVSELTGLNFANMTLVLYCILVGIELVIHIIRKENKGVLIKDILQIPLSLVFTRFMNIFVLTIPVFEKAYPDSFMGSLAGRILVLIVAIICTGVGAALSLNVRLVPNPGDGVVQAIADVIKKPVGFTKNAFDVCSILIAALIGLVFGGRIIGIGIGTILAMIGVGRVVALTNHLFKDKID